MSREMKWINIKDEKPKEDIYCLMTNQSYCMGINADNYYKGYYIKDGDIFVAFMGDESIPYNPTHYLEIPDIEEVEE